MRKWGFSMENELNLMLLNACTSDPIDYDLIEDLLKRGAEPLGEVNDDGSQNNLYDEIVDILYDNNDTPEDFYKITELFIRYGMDISKPSVPYDDENVLNPLWMFGFYSNDVVLRTLKLLLDNGLSAEDAGECWGHALFYFSNIGSDLQNDFDYEVLYDFVRKLMLIASYPHIINNDEDLQNEIWYKYNDYDLTKLRNWDEFSFDVDTSQCGKFPEIYRSIITIKEKSTGKAVWRFGICLDPEDYGKNDINRVPYYLRGM